MRTLSSLLGFFTFGLHVLVPLLGLIIIAVKVRGPVRRLGVAGCAVMAGMGLLQGIWVFAAPQLVRSLGGVTAYSAVTAAFSVVSGVGLALVIIAVVVGRSGVPARPGPPMGYPVQPPTPYQPSPHQPPPNEPTWPPR